MTEPNDWLEKRIQEYLESNNWDYKKYNDKRNDRSAYDTLMNYEIVDYLAQFFEFGARTMEKRKDEEIGKLRAELDVLQTRLNEACVRNTVDLNCMYDAAEERDQLREDNDILRTQLALCGIAADANTAERAAKDRISKDNPHYCENYENVCNAVDREMKLRERIEALERIEDAARAVARSHGEDYHANLFCCGCADCCLIKACNDAASKEDK